MRPLACLVLAVVLVPAALAAAASTPLGLTDRLAKTGELQGFSAPAASGVEVYRTAAQWAAFGSDPKTEATRLQKLGFVAAGFEHLAATKLSHRDAVSVVEQFRTAAAARAELANAVATYANGGKLVVSHFAVPGIPGATGLYAHRPDGAGYDVVFADGAFFYDVGAYSPDPKEPPTSAQIAAAAAKVYRRVHGHPAG